MSHDLSEKRMKNNSEVDKQMLDYAKFLEERHGNLKI